MKLNFPTEPGQKIFRQDTFMGFDIAILWGGSIPTPGEVELFMQVKQGSETGRLVHDAKLSDGIEPIDATLGQYRIEEFDLEFPAAIYFYDVKIRYENRTATLLYGTINNTQNVTNIPES
jgi:hypothetical protein